MKIDREVIDTTKQKNSKILGSGKVLYYYLILIIGVISILYSVFTFNDMYGDKGFAILQAGKGLGLLLFGVLLLFITLPSLKYVVLKQYDVVSSKCVIEIDSSGRSAEADFKMLDTDEVFSFKDIPDLDAYGKSIPYYCKVTVTKDHNFEIAYKIFDAKSKELIVKSD